MFIMRIWREYYNSIKAPFLTINSEINDTMFYAVTYTR